MKTQFFYIGNYKFIYGKGASILFGIQQVGIGDKFKGPVSLGFWKYWVDVYRVKK